MKAEHFRYLLEINRLKSISAAAKELHIKQNTLSALVKSVEDELGFSIFRRTPRGVTVTREGERLMALAWEISVKYEELLSLKDNVDNGTKSVNLLLCPSLNVGVPIPLAERYYRFELRGDLSFEEWPRLEIASHLQEGAANLGLTYLTAVEVQDLRKTASPSGIQASILMEDQFYVLTARNHPLAGRQVIRPSELDEVSIASVTGFYGDGNCCIPQVCDKSYGQRISFPNVALMKSAILHQGAVGILPGFAIMQDTSLPCSFYRVIPMEGDHHAYICLLSRSNRNIRYQERILISCITEYFRDIQPMHVPLPRR